MAGSKTKNSPKNVKKVGNQVNNKNKFKFQPKKK